MLQPASIPSLRGSSQTVHITPGRLPHGSRSLISFVSKSANSEHNPRSTRRPDAKASQILDTAPSRHHGSASRLMPLSDLLRSHATSLGRALASRVE